MSERYGVGRLVGDEEHDEVRRALGVLFVALTRELIDMLAQAEEVLLECLVTLRLRLSGNIARIGGEADLAIDDDGTPIGVAHDDIRAKSTTVISRRDDRSRFITQRLLHEVMLSSDEPALIEDALEDQLTPVALHLAITTQGTCEAGGLLTDLLTAKDEFLDGVLEVEAFACFFLISLIDLLTEALEVLTQRGESLLRTLVEVFGTLTHDVIRDSTEAIAQLFGELALLCLELLQLSSETCTLGLNGSKAHSGFISLLLEGVVALAKLLMCLGSRLKPCLQRLELERLLMLSTLSGSGYVSQFFDALPCVEEEHEEDEAECPKEVDHRLIGR